MSTTITNVFVLMLENHSFDHIFGYSNITGINGLSANDTNSWQYDGQTYTYPATQPAVDPMTTDPNHEFLDTLEQLCGTDYGPKGCNPYAGNPDAVYPHIDNSGFVVNYGTIADEDTGLPDPGDAGNVMSACSPDQVPVMIQLAQEFAICDNWNASIPGPTWPNRLFALAASSSGLDDTPTNRQIITWETIDGIEFQNGSIFQLLSENGLQYRLYNDWDNEFAPDPAPFWDGGEFPLAGALKGLSVLDFHDFSRFASDLNGWYPYQFTLIEPHYGNAASDTYKGGSSQHPEDNLWAGEALIAATYNAIRNSPLWDTSLLIITYDEHGGFYDHVAPPTAPPPGDTPPVDLNIREFTFNNFGVRVPAVIVSPLIAKGTVDSTQYDHTSILRTVEDLYGMGSLTQRDFKAAYFTNLIGTELRTDCPENIQPGSPPQVEASETMTREEAFADPTPLPEQGNSIGHMHIAMKTDAELSDRTDESKAAILARVSAIKTRGELRQYFGEVFDNLEAAKASAQTGA